MTQKQTITLAPRDEDRAFQDELKQVVAKWGIKNYVFVGQYIESDVQTKDRAVTSINGDMIHVMRLVDALNGLMPELMIRQFMKELPSLVGDICEDCPDKGTCKDRVVGKERCNA